MTMGTNCDLLEQMALYEKHLSRVADHTGRQLGASLLRDAQARIIMLERIVDRYGDKARMAWCDIPEMQFVIDVALERSEEHTSELQSLMRISYAVFCLKKKKSNIT